MIIKLSPVRMDELLSVEKSGDALRLNGVLFDFAALADGATLPPEAFGSKWICNPVERIDGALIVTLLMPHGAEAGGQSRFPASIADPVDGRVPLPTDDDPQPDEPIEAWPNVGGVIDWGQVVTREAKEQAQAAEHLAAVVNESAARRAQADGAIAPLQDAVDIDDATDAERLALKAWKQYRVALSRLPDQPGYPADIDWPVAPA